MRGGGKDTDAQINQRINEHRVFAKLNPLAAKSQLMISRGAFWTENASLKLGNVVIRVRTMRIVRI